MKLIKEYKGWKIWHGEQYAYTGYLVSMPGHESYNDLIRSGQTLKESYKAINKLKQV
jgi:hypothetical protein